MTWKYEHINGCTSNPTIIKSKFYANGNIKTKSVIASKKKENETGYRRDGSKSYEMNFIYYNKEYILDGPQYAYYKNGQLFQVDYFNKNHLIKTLYYYESKKNMMLFFDDKKNVIKGIIYDNNQEYKMSPSQIQEIDYKLKHRR